MSRGTTEAKTLPVLALAAMVVGSMVGAGVFSLPSTFGGATGVIGAVIAWALAGAGMLTFVLVLQRLATRKPDLDAGIFAYAKAGFGNYLGFFSAFGYWASACAGNVTYWVLICSTLSGLFPGLGAGNTPAAIVVSTIGLWGFHLLIRRGIREAAFVNVVVTVAKLVPLLTFIAIVVFAGFDGRIFEANLWGGDGSPDPGSIASQIQSTLLLTVFVFLGVEGASVYSRYARRRQDIGRASIIGFLGVLLLFVSVSLLSYGVLPREELGALPEPSLGGVLEAVVGEWGALLIGAGLIVSVLGAYLSWTLMASEVLFAAAKQNDVPLFLRDVNRHGVPDRALLLSTLLVQVLLVLVMFSEDAFTLAFSLTSSLCLIAYALSAGYGLKLETRWGDDPAGRSRRGLLVAGLATVYTVFLLIAGGAQYFVVSFLILVPGSILYVLARREQGLRVFTRGEAVVFALAVAMAVWALVGLMTGAIAI
ncbi:basic amino acid/polyamine antiporter [Agromyces sp. MMS24-JH15]|uniref:basic amino acid/polyamine antiporter n=1 Tax=Agromyces sp. MMS24-JH15 TaxID=3243765 RepID=UPI003748C7BA